MPLIAETPRLRIQTWELSDIDALCALTRLDGISEYSVSSYANYSRERATEWIRKEMDRYARFRLGKFAVVSKELGRPIGISGLFQMPPPDEQEIELNYRYPKIYRGQGFATEAARAVLDYGFYTLGLARINANADLANTASQAVLARLGMKKIGETTYAGILAGRWSITKQP